LPDPWEWVKARYALKAPSPYAEMALKDFNRGYQHEMYPALVRRVESLDSVAREHLGCPELVSEMSALWRQAGGEPRLFWYAVCDVLYALPGDDELPADLAGPSEKDLREAAAIRV
jgi:hypothetical protein